MNKELNTKSKDKVYTMVLEPNDVLYLQYKTNSNIDLATFKEVKDAGLALVKHKPFYALVDFRDRFVSMSPEVKEFTANDDELARYRIAEALLVNSLSMKLVVNTYLTFNKPKSPTKAFTTKTAALTWFSSIKKESVLTIESTGI